MKTHFTQAAAYNRFANARLYGAAFALPDADYRRDVGAFFKSLHGTLNHLLVTDRTWLHRLSGEGATNDPPDLILHDDLKGLARARADEDDRIVKLIAWLDDAGLAAEIHYANSKGHKFSQARRDALAHLFNHQAHHRGQAHTILSIVTGKEPPSLDMLLMQRGATAPDIRALAA